MEYRDFVLTVVTITTAVAVETVHAQEGDYSGNYIFSYTICRFKWTKLQL